MTLKRSIKGVLFLFLVFFILNCTDEPVTIETTGAITGQVIESETGQAVIGALITTAPPSQAIVSDQNGKFSIFNLEAGTYTISASKESYVKNSVSVSVKAGDTTTAIIPLSKKPEENLAPSIPKNKSPQNGATHQPTEVDLQWYAVDPNPEDSLKFDLYFYPANSSITLIASNFSDSTYHVDNLEYNTTYYWQVVARDNNGAVTIGETWSFKTKPVPNNSIVFCSDKDGNFEIYSTDPDSSVEKLIQLTKTINRNMWPRLSPDRKKIAFTSDSNVEPQIFLMNFDGTNPFQLTTLPVTGYYNYGIGFCWSPDGASIYFSHYETLYRIDSDRSNLTKLATAPANRNFREVAVSPFGDKLVTLVIGSWFYDSEIYLMNSDGSNLEVLVDNWPGAIESPSFSPDGKKIIFCYDVSGFEASNKRQLDSRIFIMDISSKDTIDVSKNKPAGTNDLFPRFSPDGSKIIFVNQPNDNSKSGSIWIMDIDGINRRKIVEQGIMPDWK